MKRTFIEANWFSDRLKKLGNGNLLKDIQDEILRDTEKGAVVQGTGGVRKLRIRDKKADRGKSGAYRFLYLDLPDRDKTYLLYIYSKKERDDLSPEGKKTIRDIVKLIKESS